MIYSDVPTPTPTPSPVSVSPELLRALVETAKQISISGQDYLNATSIMGLVFAVFMGLFVLVALYLWTHRSKAAAESTALTTTAKALQSSEERADKLQEALTAIPAAIKEGVSAQNTHMMDLADKHVEGMTAIADASNRNADTIRMIAQNEQQANKLLAAIHERENENSLLLAGIETKVNTIVTKGSPTLQEVAAQVRKIDEEGPKPLAIMQESLNKMLQGMTEIQDKLIPPEVIIENFSALRRDLQLLTIEMDQKLNEAIEAKHKSDTHPIVIDPELKSGAA